MIIFNAVALHVPITAFEFGILTGRKQMFLRAMRVMERLQQTVFTLQECIISGLYIFHAGKFLGSGGTQGQRKRGERNLVKRTVGLLISVQVVAVALDAGLTAFNFMNWFTLKCTLHPFVYSTKLMLEFIVLNQLLTIVKKGLLTSGGGLGGNFTTAAGVTTTTTTSGTGGPMGDDEPGNARKDWMRRFTRTVGSGNSEKNGATVIASGGGGGGGAVSACFNVPLAMDPAHHLQRPKKSSDSSIDFFARAPVVEASQVSSSSARSFRNTESDVELDEQNLEDVLGRPDEDRTTKKAGFAG